MMMMCILCAQALNLLEYLFVYIQKLNKDEEDSKMVDVVEAEIKKWIELLINNVNMSANDAVQYFKELRSHKGLGKDYNKIITASVS